MGDCFLCQRLRVTFICFKFKISILLKMMPMSSLASIFQVVFRLSDDAKIPTNYTFMCKILFRIFVWS